MVGTNAPINVKKLYNVTVQEISRGGGYFDTKVGVLCARLFDMWALVKTQVENGLENIFILRGHNIDMSDQDVFILTYMDLHAKEGNKTNTREPLTAPQMR